MIRFSRITADAPLSKAYTLDTAGALKKVGGGAMSAGTLAVQQIAGLSDLVPLLQGLTPHEAFTWGVPLDGRTEAKITTRAKLEVMRSVPLDKPWYVDPSEYIARDLDHFGWPAGRGLGLLDHDDKKSPEELLHVLTEAVPEFGDVGILAVPSSSHGIARESDGALLKPKHGWHLYFVAQHAPQIGQLKGLLAKALPTWVERSKSGARLIRYDFDLAVFSPERLDFGGATFLGAGLTKAAPASFMLQGGGALVLDRAVQVPGADLVDSAAEPASGAAPETDEPSAPQPVAVRATAAGQYMSDIEEAEEAVEAAAWLDAEHKGDLTKAMSRLCRRAAGRLTPKEKGEIEDLLTYIPADLGYQGWVAVGLALRNSLHSKDAEEMWVKWSMSAPEHDSEADLRRKFKTFRKARCGTGLNISTIQRIAASYGYRGVTKATLRALPEILPGVSEAEGRAATERFFDDLPTAPKDLRDNYRRVLLWASTGAGKSYALMRWLKRAIEEQGRKVAPAVAGFRTKAQAEAFAQELAAMGVPVFLHHGREEQEPPKAPQDWSEASCWPGQKGLVGRFFGLHQSLGREVCHRSCRIGENIEAARKGDPLPHPEMPARCWLTQHEEGIAAARRGGVVVVFSGPVPSDFHNHLTSVHHDEDAPWDDHRSAKPKDVNDLIDWESAALRHRKMVVKNAKGETAAEMEADIVRRECFIWWLRSCVNYARDPSLPKPSLGRLAEWVGDGLQGEDPINIGDEWHVPLRWVSHMIANYDTMRSVDGELRWYAPIYPDDLPVITVTATPSAETRLECAGRTTRVLIARGEQHKVLLDDSRLVGMSTPAGATKAAMLAQTLGNDAGDAFCFSQRSGLKEYWDQTLGEQPKSIAEEIALGASTTAAAVSHNKWSGKRITVIGGLNPPPEATAKLYDLRRESLIRRGADPETLPVWDGRMVPGQGAFVASEPAVEAMLAEMGAAEIVQALGRATRGQGTDRVIQHRVIGCRQGVAELLASEYGLAVQLCDDFVPQLDPDRVDARARAMQAAWALIRAGQAVTRAAVETLGKVGHEAYQWLLNESPLRLRLAPLMADKGVAARIRRGLLIAAARIGSELAAVLTAWADARAHGLDHVDGDDTEAARWFVSLDRLLLPTPPPG